MGRHRAEDRPTVELPRVPGSATGRHRPEAQGKVAVRATRKARRAARRRAWKHRATPRTHRTTPRLQTAVLVGVAAFAVTAGALGTDGRPKTVTTPAEGNLGTWLEVRPGSVSGAPGGRWVASEPRLTDPILTPSPRPTTRSATTSAQVAPTGGSTPAPALTSPSSGAGPSPSTPAADPTSATPSPYPAPTPVCRRRHS